MKTLLTAIAAALLLTACASFDPPAPGATREEVLRRYGQPTRIVPLAGGTRLQYSQQPAGQHSTMVDLDAAGKFVSARQVLRLSEFNKIPVDGRWTREDAEREFGPPASVDHVANWDGDILAYRWLDNVQPMLFWVYLDRQNVVRRTGQGIEHRNRYMED